MNTNMVSEVESALSVQAKPRGKLAKIARKKWVTVPSSADPRTELRRLVSQHQALTRKAVSIEQMQRDRVARVDHPDGLWKEGDKIPTDVPVDIREAMVATSKALKKRASGLESLMLQQLRQVPVYKLFLEKVYGCGPVVAAYLVASIDIHRSVKSSALRRYLGFAVINGRLERPTRGVKLGYNSELRTRIYQMFSAMWKNGAKGKKTSKYLTVWTNTRHRELNSERARLEPKGAKGRAFSKGWHKAADVFIEDLYTAWRAIEGLEVWPSYYAAKLGYEHGGKISVNAPKLLTVEEALALVGDVGSAPAVVPIAEEDEVLMEDDEAAE